jgi:hypothetical protein
MKYLKILMLGLIFILSSCQPKTAATPTVAPEAIYTSAAQTVAVQLTEAAKNNPSTTPTQTNTATQTVTSKPSATIAKTTAVPLAVASMTLPVTQDRVEWISQVPADGTVMSPNAAFKVSWTIKNVGQSTWTTGFSIRHFSGDRMGVGLTGAYSFPKQVLPGETVTLTIDFIAPPQTGDYKSTWVLTNQDGSNFYPVYIEMKVGTPSATPTPTITITTASTTESTFTPTTTDTP